VNFLRSVIIAQLRRPKVARCYNFFRNFWVLFGKTIPYGKIFIATPIDALCSNFVKFGRREIGEIVRCLPDKNHQTFAWLSSCRYCADRTQNLPGPAPTMYSDCCGYLSNRFTFGGVISEGVNTAETRRKVNPIFGWSLASSRITKKPSIEVAPTTLVNELGKQSVRRHFKLRVLCVHDWCCSLAIHTSSYDRHLWPVIFNFTLDLDMIKMNQHATFIFRSKVI